MGTSSERAPRRMAVVGAGNMGSGIAQKMATEGFTVVLVDLDDLKVGRGMAGIRKTLAEGVERRIFRQADADVIQSRVSGTTDWQRLEDVDLVVEAVFEDLRVKQEVFGRLSAVCRADTILASNTSSFSVRDLAAVAKNPERVLGLHYFYHPAKNRLVEVVPTALTDPAAAMRAWRLQERMGKTPIHSADQPGFVVNRYFVPWLNEAVRLLEAGVGDAATIEGACKQAFGVGMGPFELMNLTGTPIALHAATTLGEAFGPFYAPAALLRAQVEAGAPWDLKGEADPSRFQEIADRMWSVAFLVGAALVDQEVGSVEDVDIGARVGLRWPRGPFETMNRMGVPRAARLVEELGGSWGMVVPAILRDHGKEGRSFAFRLVRTQIQGGIATLTVDRPDAMNALNETVVSQLAASFQAAAADPDVRGIVLAGTGKAFIAGADIRFFVDSIERGDLDRIVSFTRTGHDLLQMIDRCDKPVVARMHGLALGGGLELALACDRIVATPKAALAFPETGIGIYPGLGGTQRTPRRIGTGLAKWLIYTGQMLPAEEAQAIGLVDAVVPFEELDAAVVEAMRAGKTSRPGELLPKHAALAAFFSQHSVEELLSGRVDAVPDHPIAKAVARVKQKAPIALRRAEHLIELAETASLEEGLADELRHLVEVFGSEDAREGLSTIGKRAPTFAGR